MGNKLNCLFKQPSNTISMISFDLLVLPEPLLLSVLQKFSSASFICIIRSTKILNNYINRKRRNFRINAGKVWSVLSDRENKYDLLFVFERIDKRVRSIKGYVPCDVDFFHFDTLYLGVIGPSNDGRYSLPQATFCKVMSWHNRYYKDIRAVKAKRLIVNLNGKEADFGRILTISQTPDVWCQLNFRLYEYDQQDVHELLAKYANSYQNLNVSVMFTEYSNFNSEYDFIQNILANTYPNLKMAVFSFLDYVTNAGNILTRNAVKIFRRQGIPRCGTDMTFWVVHRQKEDLLICELLECSTEISEGHLVISSDLNALLSSRYDFEYLSKNYLSELREIWRKKD